LATPLLLRESPFWDVVTPVFNFSELSLRSATDEAEEAPEMSTYGPS